MFLIRLDRKRKARTDSAASAARHHRLSAHGRAALRRPREVDPALEEAMAATRRSSSPRRRRRRPTTPTPEDIYSVGTVGTIIQLLRLPDGTVKVLVEGKRRAASSASCRTSTVLLVEVETSTTGSSPPELEALVRSGPGDLRCLLEAQQADRARDR
jgi:ATP-dependent Lon protease